MSAYMIAHFDNLNQEKYEAWVPTVTPILFDHGAKILARNATFELLDGSARASRFTILEFPDEAHARACFASDEYQQVRGQIRDSMNMVAMVLVPGVQSPQPESVTEEAKEPAE